MGCDGGQARRGQQGPRELGLNPSRHEMMSLPVFFFVVNHVATDLDARGLAPVDRRARFRQRAEPTVVSAERHQRTEPTFISAEHALRF